MSDGRAATRAIDAMRHGWPVTIRDGHATLTILPIETSDRTRLEQFDPGGDALVLISAGRAATLKLTNQREAATPDAPVAIARSAWLGFDEAMMLADPQFDLRNPLKGPFRAVACPHPQLAATALRLARVAGLLPAFFMHEEAADTVVDKAAADDIDLPERLVIAARARLPVERVEQAEIVAFRAPESGDEHVALLIGAPDGTAPLVRLHSECLTGDVFGSLKCDCGPQLHAAIDEIAAAGWGIIVYLRQEGRGIGLINKMRAYALQDQGFDTVDANTRLGFAVDARDFRIAARMLTLLGQQRIRLLTNNPHKVDALAAAGINVAERVPHRLPPNPHNARYLATKRDRTGHQL
ncbi:GTP cyclohydrolase II [Stakelama saccharophila]|uniref:GTP cyclohydrolase-2 n=1 Tax=Stakelama saccharophila TaxID=3075605 RepID=A0ABZ0B9D1_9SPHN|nr:GTP cyclohydrolase II [Stakelama sp. W311]WNO54022.1 GTP cyclohydrolase II [Stakelama sp. W311]